MLLIELVIALSGLLAAAVLLWKYPVAISFSLMASAILSEVAGIGQSGIPLGITVYPLDLSCVALVACCVVVSMRTRSLPRDICWPALVLLGLGLLNFGRGALLLGIKAPGNAAREIIYLVLPVAAFSFLGPALRMTVERLVTSLSLISIAFALIAAARWAGVMPMPDVFEEEFREVVRVLPADYAIIIGQALIGVLGVQLMRGFQTIGLLVAGLFAALVLALQHRSVWIATLAGLVWLALRSPRLNQREWLKISSLTLLLASGLTLAALLASGPVEKALKLVNSNVQEISQEDSTWEWRMAGYTEAVQRVFSNGLAEATLGPPSGRDLTDTASVASIHIHDRYIHTLTYFGVGGLVVLMVWLFSTWARIQRLASKERAQDGRGIRRSAERASGDRQARLDKVILEAMFISTLVYFVPYTGGQLEGWLLGVIWLASANRRTQHENPAPEAGPTPVFKHRLPSPATSTVSCLF